MGQKGAVGGREVAVVGVHKKTASWQKEQMVMTRVQRRAEVVARCTVAVAQ